MRALDAAAAAVVLQLAAALAAAPARAQADEDVGPAGSGVEERLESLEAQIEALKLEVAQARQPPVRPLVPLTFSGYLDLGFFAPVGNGGVGYVQDLGNAAMPEYRGRYAWVFLGDILATAVNSRGEPADLGSAPGVQRFDSVHSRGAMGFIVNEASLALSAGLGESALATVRVNFVPRSGSDFSLGDFLDLDLAQLEWMPTEDRRTSIFVGKIDSVLGIEYRDRKADHRFGVTPSLIARYTTGTALGLKVRTKLFQNDWLILAAALTNGTNTWESFHFYDEVDSNSGKTGSARVAVRLPVPGELEIGVSGMAGSQDRATDSSKLIWFAGADLQYRWRGLSVKAQYLQGGSPGEPSQGVYGLALHHGAYLEVDWMIVPWLGLMARGDLRDALVFLGDERAYVTKSWRATGGLRFAFSQNVTLKAEFLHNGEYGGVPEFLDDVFTSSLVVSY